MDILPFVGAPRSARQSPADAIDAFDWRRIFRFSAHDGDDRS
jgi:hypothetical protein